MNYEDKVSIVVAASAFLVVCHVILENHAIASINEDLGFINGKETLEIIEGFNDKNRWLSNVFEHEALFFLTHSESTYSFNGANTMGEDHVSGFSYSTGNLYSYFFSRRMGGAVFGVNNNLSNLMNRLTSDERGQLATNLRARLIEEAIARYEEETGETVCFTDSREETMRYRATGQCNTPTP